MPELVTTSDALEKAPKFSLTEHAIAGMAEEYMPLVCKGLEDTIGYSNVRSARIVVKRHRCDIEKTRKMLKADALKYGRTVDGEAKRLTALLEPVESHLLAEEKKVDDAKEAIREEKRLKAEAAAQAKRDAEAAEIKRKADEEAARIKAEQDAENERLRVEREKLEAERKAEEKKQREAQEKLNAERLAHEKQIKAEWQEVQDKAAAEETKRYEAQEKIDAQNRVIEAERKRLADIEAERVRLEELEKAKAEAAEKAQKETVARMAWEAEEKAAKVKAEEDARVRAEALRPDREKIEQVAIALEMIPIPDMSTNDGEVAARQVRRLLDGWCLAVRDIVEEMS
jgi:hypothetical protein